MFRIVGCTHINAQTAVLVETLVALGAQVHQVDVGLRSEGKTKPAVLRYCPIRPRTLCENSLKTVNDTVYCEKNSICHLLFHITVLQYYQYSAESSGLKLMNTFLIYLLFLSC